MKTIPLLISLLLTLSFSSVAYTADFERKYSEILLRAGGLTNEAKFIDAYQTASKLRSICASEKHITNAKCNAETLEQTLYPFRYLALFSVASDLSNKEQKHGAALALLAGLQPQCIFVDAEKCTNYHEALVAEIKLNSIISEASNLFQQEKLEDAEDLMNSGRALLPHLTESHERRYVSMLALIQSVTAPARAVVTLEPIMGRMLLLENWKDFYDYWNYVDLLLRANDLNRAAFHFLNFFQQASAKGGFINSLQGNLSRKEAMSRLFMVLDRIVATDGSYEFFMAPISEARSIEAGIVQRELGIFMGDLSFVSRGEQNLAYAYYISAGLENSEALERIKLVANEQNYAIELHSRMGNEPELIDLIIALHKAADLADESLLYENWKALANAVKQVTPDEVADNPSVYLQAVRSLVIAVDDTQDRRYFFAESVKQTESIYQVRKSDFEQIASSFNPTSSSHLEKLMEYSFLTNFRIDAALEHQDYKTASELGLEVLRLEELRLGQYSPHLLGTLTKLAKIYRLLEDSDSYEEIYARAKELESRQISSGNSCLDSLSVFLEPAEEIERHVNGKKILESFSLLANAHIENAANFLGIEKNYRCSYNVEKLISDYYITTDIEDFSIQTLFSLYQILGISDLTIISESGINAASESDSKVNKSLHEFTSLSHQFNLPTGTQEAVDPGILLKYFAKKKALHKAAIKSNPDLQKLLTPTPMSVPEIFDSLENDEALLQLAEIPEYEYFSPSDNIIVTGVLLTKSRVYHLPLITVKRSDLTLNRNSVFETLKQRVSRFSQIQPFNLKSAKFLYNTFFANAHEILKGMNINKVLVAPSHHSQGIPFEIFPLQAELPEIYQFYQFGRYREIEWANDRYQLSYLSSARMLRTRTVGYILGSGKFLGVGNPKFLVQEEPAGHESQKSQVNSIRKMWSEVLTPSKSSTLSLLSADPYPLSFQALPDTHGILLSIAENFTPENVVLLEEGMAVESELKNMELSSFSTLVFATHAVLESISDDGPALILGNEMDSVAYDSMLSAREIAALQLKADLVILAACSSASPEQSKGLVSLANSFLAAGAKNVVASHWPVDVKATLSLFRHFSASHEVPDKTPNIAQRLQIARIKVLRESQNQFYSHPLFWGGFTLLGI